MALQTTAGPQRLAEWAVEAEATRRLQGEANMWVPTLLAPAWAQGIKALGFLGARGRPLPRARPPVKEPLCRLHVLLSPPHTWHSSGTCPEPILPSQPNVCAEGRAGASGLCVTGGAAPLALRVT